MKNKAALIACCIIFASTSIAVAAQDDSADKSQNVIVEAKNFDDKNEVLSYVAKAALDFYLKGHGYGELKEFSINNKTKKFFFKTKLKGEEKFLSVSVNKYDIVRENGKYFFIAKQIVTDREWLNTAAKNFLEEKKIEIPSQYSIFILAAM